MRPSYDVKEEYIGAGNLADYTFSFKIEALLHLEVIEYNAAGEETQRVRGDDVTYLSSVEYDNVDGGGTVHLAANLPTGYTLILLLANDLPTQPRAYKEKNSFTLRNFEMLFDFVVGPIQRLFYLIKRGLRLPDNLDPDDYDLFLPAPEADTVIGWDAAGTALQNYTFDEITSAAGLVDGTLGDPTDGAYGSVTHGPIAGVANGDLYEDAFDKVEVILGKLAPAKPQDCADATLVITGSYTAYESNGSTPVLHATVTDDTTPTISHGTDPLADGIYDGDAGTLSATMDAVSIGSITLTTADDTGTNGELEIVTDSDPYVGIFGKQDFWKAIVAQINSAALSVAQHIATLVHSVTGTCTLTFYVDDPVSPTISGNTITGSGTGRTVSGIPCLTTGDTITAAFTVNDAIKTHYNSTRIARATSSVTNSVNEDLPGTAPVPDDTFAASIALTVAAGQFSANASVDCIGYNSKGDTVTQATTNNIRVDSISVETTRKKSGAGQYPTIGSGATQFGDAFDSTALLTAANNEELQLENATYKYPAATDYSSNTPTAGPDYTGVAAGSYSNMRWATFNLGAISAVTGATFTIAGQANFGASVLISGIALYVKVDGAIPTTGWIDANAAYPGVGNPTANGDAALVVGSSTVSSRRITFGASVKTGNLWVRIGIPSGSTKTFTGIS